jgi:hypothetical protein
VIDELRQLMKQARGLKPGGPGRAEDLLRAVLARQGHPGFVWIVTLDTFAALTRAKEFVALAKEAGHTGTLRNQGRQVVIEPTTFGFITLGEDGTTHGETAPRFIDDDALLWAVEKLVRETAGAGAWL